MSQTLNKKQLKEKLWNPNLLASESIFWSNSVKPADPDHPGVPRFFQWCGRNLFSHKVVDLVEQSCLFAQHVHWCDLNCQRKEGSRERLWVVCAWSHLVSPSKAVNSRIHWRADLNSNRFHFCVKILKPESKTCFTAKARLFCSLCWQQEWANLNSACRQNKSFIRCTSLTEQWNWQGGPERSFNNSCLLSQNWVLPTAGRCGRYVLIIHFYVELGQKLIQFNIQFKIESKIFI